MKTALVTGATGQIGSYLCEILLDKGYKVLGLYRRTSISSTERIKHLFNNKLLELIQGDITDPVSIFSIIDQWQPDEVYNCAAQSYVATSFNEPKHTIDVTGVSPLYLLEAILKFSPYTRFVQYSSSEQFGSNIDSDGFQRETTQFVPASPYACAKVLAHNLTVMYRNAYKMFACCAINFNSESPRRLEQFVTRKITKYVGELYIKGNTGKLHLGNLEAFRDWSYAYDTAYGSYLMLQQDKPQDYVFASGKTSSVKQFLEAAFQHIGINDWQNYVEIDSAHFRPLEVPLLRGDATKARNELGWVQTLDFPNLVKLMVDHDIKLAYNG